MIVFISCSQDKPMDKDELQSDYEDFILSRESGIFLKQIITENLELLSSSETPIYLIDWIVRHCALTCYKDMGMMTDIYENADIFKLIHFIFNVKLSVINEWFKKTSNEYCHFLKYGYKKIRLSQIKLSHFPSKEFNYFPNATTEL